jgi:hypothetical protein
MSAIPTLSRDLVSLRDGSRCVRCGGFGYHWHHRRSRRVADEHQHCPCVGIMLCATCHRWVHQHPREAMAEGLIVSTFEVAPWTVPVHGLSGWMLTACDGKASPYIDKSVNI